MTRSPSTPDLRLPNRLSLTDRVFGGAASRRLQRAVDDGMTEVEAYLGRELHMADDIADAAGRYLFEAGGKRIRPMLCLLTAQLGDGVTKDVIASAAALELTHLGSLYHDDVMDGADVRRGVPAAHEVWGNNVAILTGDLLFSRASQIMASLGEAATKLQADTFERLVLGQMHETVGPKPEDDRVAFYIQVLADKTGSLIAAAAEAGVLFSNAPAEYRDAVLQFGEKIGVAFQLLDDVIDLSADPDETGKVPGTDLRAGVPTMPYLLLASFDDAASADLLRRIDEGVARIAEGADAAVLDAPLATLREHAATERTRALAHDWARDAVAALGPLPNGAVKEALTRFSEAVVDRTS